ncbi:HNH endonuclease [Streptomyces nymphaeiformis]|uniref:5-methylcytosine-specific restriction endonuclease McrA n=1 Tax=Streptomyces nymphaeiformis TaxID=2663842 RepID=A0A7W7XED5_9ACTN|nr:HNH endonuclease signature motif containing protein [Streptomyces nymphaeiformis]MBB4985022.1 5-methylcytosine-specific restriction endonuclease McrA [Streptomyces nymphaeiformis]
MPQQRYCGKNCKRRHKRARRRARQSNAGGCYTWEEVIGLFLRFDRRCSYCHRRLRIDEQPEPDHVVPLSRGGSNALSNILPACSACNSDKRDLLLTEWADDRHRRGLPAVATSWDPADHRYSHLALQPA